LKVIAVCTERENDPSTARRLERLRRPGATHGHTVLDYKKPDALLRHLQELVRDSDECIEVLEIIAHGTAGKIGGIIMGDIQRFGDALNRLNRFCRSCKIYLTSCNIGLPYPPEATMYPMPKVLAISTGCTVYACIGYSNGTHAEGNTSATPDCTYQGKYYKKLDGCPIDGRVTGDACYREFKK
jgi:hypothetical protein